MSKKQQTADAVAILHRRYVGDDPKRKAALAEERMRAKLARLSYELRTAADQRLGARGGEAHSSELPKRRGQP